MNKINYQVGDIIEGTITEIRNYGAILMFIDGSRGLLHISEIADNFIRNIKRYLTVGKTYQVKVVGVLDDGFLKLSMNKITPEEKISFREVGQKKNPIPESEIDFTALKENLEKWIIVEKGGNEHD